MFLARVRGILKKMKTSLSLLLVYIVICIFGTAAGSMLYMMYGDLLVFVAGKPLVFFSADLFIRGAFFTFPLVCAFSSLFMVLYIVRHPAKILFPLITYILTGALSWGLLIPFCTSLSAEYELKSPAKASAEIVVSPGFFREDNGGVYYYSRVGQDGKAEGLYIDLQGFSGEQGKVIPLDNAPVNMQAAAPFSDLLIRDTVTLPRVVKVPVDLYKKQLLFAQSARSAGYISWLCFASLGVALLSVFALRKFSAWRLLSACVATAAFIGIGVANCACYGSGALASAANRSIGWWTAFCSKVPGWLSWLAKIQSPFVVIMNVGICLVLVILGIVLDVVRKHHQADGSEEEAA